MQKNASSKKIQVRRQKKEALLKPTLKKNTGTLGSHAQVNTDTHRHKHTCTNERDQKGFPGIDHPSLVLGNDGLKEVMNIKGSEDTLEVVQIQPTAHLQQPTVRDY